MLNRYILKPIDLGKLDRVEPISKVFGFDRGRPIDRYYIEKFLSTNSSYIKGDVLEIADNEYTKKFGGNNVTKSHILNAVESQNATIVGDLTKADNILDNSFDCIILTQTIHVIYDIHSVVKNSYRILKPNGVLLVTTPGITQVSRYDMDRWGDYWRFTDLSARKLFEEYFKKQDITIQTFGNVQIAVAMLYGLAFEDINIKNFDYHDPDYQVTITIRAVKHVSE